MGGRAAGRLASVWLLLCALSSGCASPIPTIRPERTASPPKATATNGTAGPTPTSQLTAHYGDGDLAFDYPADWPVLEARGLADGLNFTIVALGFGEWEPGCVSVGNSTSCHPNTLSAEPGKLVVEFLVRGHGPAAFIHDPPPFDAPATYSGLPVVFDDQPELTTATVYLPGRSPLMVRAVFGVGIADTNRAAVHHMVETISNAGQAAVQALNTWRQIDDARCQSTFVGRLGRGDFGGLNMVGGPEYSTVIAAWPDRWSASLGSDGRADLKDADGALVAREWDEVTVIGYEDNSQDFRVCEPVVVSRSFPD